MTNTNGDNDGSAETHCSTASPAVAVGQVWRRSNGVLVTVKELRVRNNLREAYLVPVSTPDGVTARSSWKWEEFIRFEMQYVPQA